MKKIFLILAGIICAFILFFLIKTGDFYSAIFKKSSSSIALSKKIEDKKIFNILVMGYGGEGHDGPYLTDTMMIAHFDTIKKKILIISIPRDIWVKVPTKSGDVYHQKINAVYQIAVFSEDYPDLASYYASNQDKSLLVKNILKSITGLTIDNYIAVDFGGFIKAVDILGGVDVEMERTFDDNQYPIEGKQKDLCGKIEADLPELEKIATKSPELAFPCRYEKLHFDKGVQHMDGVIALKFVRSRHSQEDGSDFGRDTRQQKFLLAVKNKVLSIGFISKIIPLLDEMKNHIITDISLEQLQKYLSEFSKSSDYKIDQLVISDKNFLDDSYSTQGGYILVPKKGIDQWDEVKKGIENMLKELPIATVSPTIINDE